MSWLQHCSRCFYNRCLSCPVNICSNQKCLPRTRFASEKWNTNMLRIQQNSGDHNKGASQWLHDSWHLIFEEEAGGRRKQCPDPVAFSKEVLIFKCCYANWEVQLVHEISAIFITICFLKTLNTNFIDACLRLGQETTGSYSWCPVSRRDWISLRKAEWKVNK